MSLLHLHRFQRREGTANSSDITQKYNISLLFAKLVISGLESLEPMHMCELMLSINSHHGGSGGIAKKHVNTARSGHRTTDNREYR